MKRKWWQVWIIVAVVGWSSFVLIASSAASGYSLWFGLVMEGTIGSIGIFMAIKRFRQNF